MRAASVVRADVTMEGQAVQRAAFLAACKARGWEAGPTERLRAGGGPGACAAVPAWLRSRAAGVVVVDALDRLADTEVARVAVLALLRRRGVRLLAVADGIDTGDPIGFALVTDLITAPTLGARRTA
ncbi:recombinase family protein [Frankia sp. AgKG'84/4]|uniref:recombinase family protein n=1 Tax=Frankia sp. AgKG'84/4 TaxID=573490 RepID=UPI00200BF4C5|nr:recombinase family protein [Frankia sp. AgKG'84/4]MCL9796146.1 recombinase family protein [Frankia sp. AgKG'84/4]